MGNEIALSTSPFSKCLNHMRWISVAQSVWRVCYYGIGRLIWNALKLSKCVALQDNWGKVNLTQLSGPPISIVPSG